MLNKCHIMILYQLLNRCDLSRTVCRSSRFQTAPVEPEFSLIGCPVMALNLFEFRALARHPSDRSRVCIGGMAHLCSHPLFVIGDQIAIIGCPATAE